MGFFLKVAPGIHEAEDYILFQGILGGDELFYWAILQKLVLLHQKFDY